jgi:hypothetical protein
MPMRLSRLSIISIVALATAFEAADIGAIDVGAVGKLFLRQSGRKTKAFQIGGKNLAQFHPHGRPPLQSI